jgi:cytidylate kinase
VNAHVSPVSAQVDVRKRVVAWLRRLSDLGPLVMEGRDIGTAVFPGTPLKFYLDASLEERVRRRQAEEGAASAGNVGESISRRDRIDSSRSVAPLKAASDAVIVDSTAMSIPEVAETILRVVRERIAV